MQTVFIELNVEEDDYEEELRNYQRLTFLRDVLISPANASKTLSIIHGVLFPSSEEEEEITGPGATFYKLQTWALMSSYFNNYEWSPEEIADLQELDS